MCGIIAGFTVTNKKNTKLSKTSKHIVQLYEDQHGRGQSGFGLIHWDPNKEVKVDRATEPVKFLLDMYMCNAKFMIAHHRAPTSTGNYMDQTHPMKVSMKELEFDYQLVHNGIIANARELKEVHFKRYGYEYNTAYKEAATNGYQPAEKFNDSESLAVEIALLIEGKSEKKETGLDKKLNIPVIEISGSAAFIVVQIDKNTGKSKYTFVGRNLNSPLTMHKDANRILFASENLETEVPAFTLFRIDTDTLEMTTVTQFLQIPYGKDPIKSIVPITTAIPPHNPVGQQPIGFKPTSDAKFGDGTSVDIKSKTAAAPPNIPTISITDYEPMPPIKKNPKAETIIEAFEEDCIQIMQEFIDSLHPYPEYSDPKEFTVQIHERMNWLIKELSDIKNGTEEGEQEINDGVRSRIYDDPSEEDRYSRNSEAMDHIFNPS